MIGRRSAMGTGEGRGIAWPKRSVSATKRVLRTRSGSRALDGPFASSTGTTIRFLAGCRARSPWSSDRCSSCSGFWLRSACSNPSRSSRLLPSHRRSARGRNASRRTRHFTKDQGVRPFRREARRSLDFGPSACATVPGAHDFGSEAFGTRSAGTESSSCRRSSRTHLDGYVWRRWRSSLRRSSNSWSTLTPSATGYGRRRWRSPPFL
jgi:hypothetical protein